MADLASYKTRAPLVPTHKITPLERLDFTWDFTKELAEDDDTIASYVVTVETLVKYQVDQASSKKVVSFIAGAAGVANTFYLASCKITTTINQRIFQRDRWLLVVSSR